MKIMDLGKRNSILNKWTITSIFLGLLFILLILKAPLFLYKFLVGIFGVYVFVGLIGVILFLSLAKIFEAKRRLVVKPKFLLLGLLTAAPFLIALHLAFSSGFLELSFGKYLSACYTETPTAGGLFFGVFAYIFNLIAGGVVGAILILAIWFVAGLTIIISSLISEKGERKALAPKAFTPTESKQVKQDVVKDLYKKIDTKYSNLLEEESKRRHDKAKSILGIDIKSKSETAKPIEDNVVPLNELEGSPIEIEEVNASSMAAAGAFLGENEPHAFENPFKNSNPPQTNGWSSGNSWGEPAQNNGWSSGNNWSEPAPVWQPETPQNSWNAGGGENNFGGGNGFVLGASNFGSPNNGFTQNSIFGEPVEVADSDTRTSRRRAPQNEPAYTPRRQVNMRKYVKPTVDLIHTESASLDRLYLDAKQKEARLNSLFGEQGVQAKVDNISVAPAVTRFEVALATGERVARIKQLALDINLALGSSSINYDFAIEGKNAIGIEVPNKQVMIVSIKDLLSSKEFMSHPSPLAVCVGKDLEGKPVIADIKTMPHLLIAGTTGSGKSVCVNTILTSLLYKADPEVVKLMLVDLKKVELNAYNRIPHMIVPETIKEVGQVLNALKWLKMEMDRRYTAMEQQTVNNITDYHKLPSYINGTLDRMPYIVMLIDEAAELMSSGKREVEEVIRSLIALARAAGIHIIFATQRPSVDVITGVIKANFPTRMAFRVLSSGDSQTILNQGGAEKLVGRGDMIFAEATGSRRVQCAYIENDELRRVLNYVRGNNDTDFDIELEDIIQNGIPYDKATSGPDGVSHGVQDPMFLKVLRYAVRDENLNGTLSISEIQRKFQLGFGRAGRIVDQLAQEGYVSQDNNSGKARKVITTRAEVEDTYGEE
ncbi:MAG: DNA translocase FtsK [Christensenellaceae bacterium]|jgi:DNA segregation ATPase FtsK/SpoIIIE-like protein|nr:DNA translocase FtsK [Christensenellaceae bacterium]